jgi:hypothetical protein
LGERDIGDYWRYQFVEKPSAGCLIFLLAETIKITNMFEFLHRTGCMRYYVLLGGVWSVAIWPADG